MNSLFCFVWSFKNEKLIMLSNCQDYKSNKIFLVKQYIIDCLNKKKISWFHFLLIQTQQLNIDDFNKPLLVASTLNDIEFHAQNISLLQNKEIKINGLFISQQMVPLIEKIVSKGKIKKIIYDNCQFPIEIENFSGNNIPQSYISDFEDSPFPIIFWLKSNIN